MNATSVGVGRTRGVNSSQRLCNDRETTWYVVTPAGSLQLDISVLPRDRQSPRERSQVDSGPTLYGRPLLGCYTRVLQLQAIVGAAGAVVRAEPLRHDRFEAYLEGLAADAVAFVVEEL